MHQESWISPEKALELLIKGNKRFIDNDNTHFKKIGFDVRIETSKGQKPFCAILTCSDSRVVPEFIFDAGLGEIFVARIAGNILTEAVLGSLEYAVEFLSCPLVVVLGHSHCGAIKTAIDLYLKDKKIDSHNLDDIIRRLEDAVAISKSCEYIDENIINQIVKKNIEFTCNKIFHQSDIIKEKVTSGHVKIIGAYYDLTDGDVKFTYPQKK
jgi:carbonic anhydrase